MSNTRHFLRAIFFISCASFGGNIASAEELSLKVEDRHLQLVREGQGAKRVIFESGFGQPAQVWTGIMQNLGESYTSISYSRSGLGKSKGDGQPRTIDEHLNDLLAVVRFSAGDAKVILVGHSYGGLLATEFARRYPDLLSGLVLVDPATLHQRITFKKLANNQVIADDKKLLAMLPPSMAKDYQLLIDQLDGMQNINVAQYPELPIVLLTSTKVEAEPFVFEESALGKNAWKDLHAQLFSQFSRGMHIQVADAGHNLHRERPELVIDAVHYLSR